MGTGQKLRVSGSAASLTDSPGKTHVLSSAAHRLRKKGVETHKLSVFHQVLE